MIHSLLTYVNRIRFFRKFYALGRKKLAKISTHQHNSSCCTSHKSLRLWLLVCASRYLSTDLKSPGGNPVPVRVRPRACCLRWNAAKCFSERSRRRQASNRTKLQEYARILYQSMHFPFCLYPVALLLVHRLVEWLVFACTVQ